MMGRRRKKKMRNRHTHNPTHKYTPHNDSAHTTIPRAQNYTPMYTKTTDPRSHIFFGTNESSAYKLFTATCIIAGITQSFYISVHDGTIYNIPCKEITKYTSIFTKQHNGFVAATTDNILPDTFWKTLRMHTATISNNKAQITIYAVSDTFLYVITVNGIYWIVNNYIAALKICALYDIHENTIQKHNLKATTRFTITNTLDTQIDMIDQNISLRTSLEKGLVDLIRVPDIDGNKKKINALQPVTKQIILDNTKPSKKAVDSINLMWDAITEIESEDAIIEFIEFIESSTHILEMVVGE